MKTEARPFVDAMRHTQVYKLRRLVIIEGSLDGKRLVLAYNAIGMKNAAVAAQLLIDRYALSCLIMSGTAGGIDSRLLIGDTVVATETGYHDRTDETVFTAQSRLLDCFRDALKEDPPQHPLYFGRIATGKSFVKKGQRLDIISRIDPLCVDMESAAVAEVCKGNDVPFVAVRSISDTETKAGLLVFIRNCLLASIHSFEVTKAFLRSQ